MNTKTPKIEPRNLSAQLSYRGRGNPPVSHPSSAISNCFPGLEFDFRAIWRRIFVGIEEAKLLRVGPGVSVPQLSTWLTRKP